MAVPKTTAAADVRALAYLNMGRQYHKAADLLFAMNEDIKKAGDHQTITEPVSFLYFQTVELVLKAFLRAHGLSIVGTKRMSHALTELYEECRDLGLVIDHEDRFTIGNIVSLLESSNVYQGFRYFTLKSRTLPDLEWTREVVAALVEVVATEVEARDPPEKGAKAAKIDIIFGRPVPKVKPEPP